MSQQQMVPEQKHKKKAKAKLEFDTGKVFEPEPAEVLELDLDSARFHAQKGEGGDRRA